MPPKIRQTYETALRKKRVAERIRRNKETEEQREIKRNKQRTYVAQLRAQSHDLFTQQVKISQELKMCQELYETIRNHKTQEGRLLCQSFIRAPNRKSLPDYYDIITSSIDLLKIQQKLKAKGYIDIQQFTSDIELIVSNAKSYYKESSQEYQDACELWKVFSDAKISKEEDKSKEIDDLFKLEIENQKVRPRRKRKEGRRLRLRKLREHLRIKKLLKQSAEPENISDQGTVEERQKRRSCSQTNDSVSKDHPLDLFTPQEAATLIKKRQSCQANRTRNKLLSGGQQGSTSLVETKEVYTDPIDVGNKSEPKDAQLKLQWVLHETVTNFIDSTGYKLSELFWTLPSRRYYPDYYKEIKEPISLFTIKTKIKHRQYSSLLKVVADINLVFKYAKMYNTADSKIFKSAVMLEKVMQEKAKELTNLHMKLPIPCKSDYKKQATQSPAGSTQRSTSHRNRNLPYKCKWGNCDHQFVDRQDLINHLDNKPYGHVWQPFIKKDRPGKFECMWYNCGRIKKNFQRFSNIYGLIRHVKEVHLKMSSKNTRLKHREKKEKLEGIGPSQSNPTTSDVKSKPPFDALVTQPAADYVFEGKCKKCNFSDIQVSDETTDGCNAGIVLKCTMCPTTKVLGMEYPSLEDKHKHPNSQVSLIDLPQEASIKQELISPDDRTNPSFISSSSEPTRIEMKFYMDQDENSMDTGSESSDTSTAVDATENIATTSDDVIHTQTPLQCSIRQLYDKYWSIQKTPTSSSDDDTPAAHARPLVIRQKTTHHYSSPLQTSFATATKQLRVQPITTQQVPANSQSQQSVSNHMQVPIMNHSQSPFVDLPQVANIKQEPIVPDDGMNVSFSNSSSEPIRAEKIFCRNQDQSTSKISAPSDTCIAMDVAESITVAPDAFAHTRASLQWSSSPFLKTSDNTPTDDLPVDLKSVKKEVEDETLCH